MERRRSKQPRSSSVRARCSRCSRCDCRQYVLGLTLTARGVHTISRCDGWLRLKHTTSDAARSRAWIRIALNENSCQTRLFGGQREIEKERVCACMPPALGYEQLCVCICRLLVRSTASTKPFPQSQPACVFLFSSCYPALLSGELRACAFARRRSHAVRTHPAFVQHPFCCLLPLQLHPFWLTPQTRCFGCDHHLRSPPHPLFVAPFASAFP